MKRARSGPPARPSGGKPAPAQRRSGALARPALMGAVVVGIALAAFGWWRLRAATERSNVPREGAIPVAGMTTEAMLDSVRVHFERRDWAVALRWAHECNVSAPGTPSLLLNEALAWHNFAQDPSQEWPGRPASRTSLDRIEMEKRAFALLDSAEAVATGPEEWANLRRWRGTQYEVLGLPLDALLSYDTALQRSPGYRPAMERLSWLQRVIIDPADPKGVTAEKSRPHP
ncbi:MAG: hypothetical protein IT348_15890 [Candidatus Eisenbacteria bacterium]|nr:hypothetical protein [Candidatus Eisenbacteria bacterium]